MFVENYPTLAADIKALEALGFLTTDATANSECSICQS
jgi:hypothetical protein